MIVSYMKVPSTVLKRTKANVVAYDRHCAGMNNTATPEADDFRFCYAGMAGTRTGLHRDGEHLTHTVDVRWFAKCAFITLIGICPWLPLPRGNLFQFVSSFLFSRCIHTGFLIVCLA